MRFPRAPLRFRWAAFPLALCLAACEFATAGENVGNLAAAARLAAEGKREEALKLVDKAVAAKPTSILAQRLYQDLMLAAGKREALMARYQRARKRKKNRRLLGIIRYLEARAGTDLAEKRKKLEALALSRGFAFWAAYDLAAVCTAAGDMAAAEKHGGAARDLRPRDADVRNVLANVYMQAGKLKEAEAEIKEALRLRPKFAQAHYNLGLIRAAAKKYEEAVALFRKAAGESPRFAEAHNNMGHCLARLNRPDEAIAAYKKAIAARPDYASAHNNLAVAQYRKKDYWSAWKYLMLAEKHGHVIAPTFKRVLKKRLFPEKKSEPKKPAGSAPPAL